MGKRFKGLTTVGIMAGIEFGADFFKSWRVAKACNFFEERHTDFILVPGSILNVDGLNTRFIDQVCGRRKKEVKKSEITHRERRSFCDKVTKQLLDDVFPVITGQDGEIIKYWIFPCPLFELKKDKLGIATYIYENFTAASQKITGKDPYVRIGNENELLEIEDNVAIRTLGVITPNTSFFRAKILSTPIEREITYRQLSSMSREIPDLYVAGSFAATLNEPNPRAIPQSRPYISVPSLSIKFTETVLQNTLGYSTLSLFPDRKNRAQYEFEIMPLTDAIDLECQHANKQIQLLSDKNQKEVAVAIIDKIRVGTKVTVGKIEGMTGLTREDVVKAINGLTRANFKVDLELGEVKNAYRIIPDTKKDLTQHREGAISVVSNAAGACLHIPDLSVDYDFIEDDLSEIIVEDQIDTFYLVGDISEGNKYDQDRNGQLLDRFAFPQDQKQLAGYLMATRVAFPVFKKRFEATKDIAGSLLRMVTIPGNHDAVRNEQPLESYQAIFLKSLTDFVYEYLKSKSVKNGNGIDYHNIMKLVQEKVILLKNPSIDGSVGLLHEYSQSAEQSTGKVQKAIKPFMLLARGVKTLLLANHHEQNFSVFRIGKKTVKAFHIGTFKRFYDFESQRSKISEFGIAVWNETYCGDELVRVNTKFVPSRIDFNMRNALEFLGQNRTRGVAYYNELHAYLDKGEVKLPA